MSARIIGNEPGLFSLADMFAFAAGAIGHLELVAENGDPHAKAKTAHGRMLLENLRIGAMQESRAIIDHAITSLLWGQSGFQVVEVDEKLAASLASTDLGGLEPKLPWPTYVVKLPAWCVCEGFDGLPERLTFAVLSTYQNVGDPRVRIDAFGERQTSIATVYKDLAKLAKGLELDDVTEYDGPRDKPKDYADKAIAQLIARLCVGVAVEMEAAPKFAKRRAALLSERFTMRDKAAGHAAATWVLSRPVKIDCCKAVEEELEAVRQGHARGPLRVRTLVRGHWKRQVCGPKRADRKVIHVEPFWRGCKDAPIPIRPHVMGEETS